MDYGHEKLKLVLLGVLFLVLSVDKPGLSQQGKNGWVYVGEYESNSVYERYLGCTADICYYERKMSHWRAPMKGAIDCRRWQYIGQDGGRSDIMPGSKGERPAQVMCR